MHPKSIRWQQRFQNFERAFRLLQSAIDTKTLSELQRAGLIQFFEMTFELAWKTLKDYLEFQGYMVKTPRDTNKQALKNEIISEGRSCLNALDDRNFIAHTYDEGIALKVEAGIRNHYFPVVRYLYEKLKTQITIRPD